jgi:hypothetical protein
MIEGERQPGSSPRKLRIRLSISNRRITLPLLPPTARRTENSRHREVAGDSISLAAELGLGLLA